MKLLYANDRPGAHAPSWYHDTSDFPPLPSLERHLETQVCIIGAGFTGLSAAIELRRKGIDCVVLDAHRVGWGASGRNGGQLGTGFNMDQLELEAIVGIAAARTLWNIAEDAKRWIHALCENSADTIDYQPGIVYALHRQRFVKPMHAYCEHLTNVYGYEAIRPLDAKQIRARVASDSYHGGAVDFGAGHVHPLKLAHLMADTAIKGGAVIHELSEVTAIQRRPGKHSQRVVTASGSVSCESVIFATNGYLDDLHQPTSRRLMPINNFIVVTEPLGDVADQLLPRNDAVADSRFVVNYFRRVAGDRLLFGGGENYAYRFPEPIAPVVKKAMVSVFPQLYDASIDYAWGGTLSITRNRLPFIGKTGPDQFAAGGYSGHGIALACIYGKALADHLAGDSRTFDVLSKLPGNTFPGGNRLRPALLALAMTGYSWLDKI